VYIHSPPATLHHGYIRLTAAQVRVSQPRFLFAFALDYYCTALGGVSSDSHFSKAAVVPRFNAAAPALFWALAASSDVIIFFLASPAQPVSYCNRAFGRRGHPALASFRTPGQPHRAARGAAKEQASVCVDGETARVQGACSAEISGAGVVACFSFLPLVYQ